MGESVSGDEVHAHIYETLLAGRFLTDVKDSTILAVCAAFTIAAGLIFGLLSGWSAYAAAAPLHDRERLGPALPQGDQQPAARRQLIIASTSSGVMLGSSVSIARVAVLRLSFDASSMRPKTGADVGI